MHEATYTTLAVPPFRLDLSVRVLRRRATNIVDQWDGRSYSRVLILGNELVKLTVIQSNDTQLNVKLQSKNIISSHVIKESVSQLNKILGLDINLQPFYNLAAKDTNIASSVSQFMGVKPPRYPTLFEALVNAVACQQISLDAAIAILNRLVITAGSSFTAAGKTMYAFPKPEDLASISIDAYKAVGFSRQKAATIKGLSSAIVTGRLDLRNLETASNDEAVAYLRNIRGIGRWSAEYTLLRGLGRLDIFPGDDVGGQNNLRQSLQLRTKPDYEGVRKYTKSWNPYAGLVYFHFLLNKLAIKDVP